MTHRPDLSGLKVASARISYGGRDRMDVTTKSTHPLGRRFAPTKELLDTALRERALAKEIIVRANLPAFAGDEAGPVALRSVLLEAAELIESFGWSLYQPGYMAERRLHAGLLVGRPWEKLSVWERAAWKRGVRPRPEDWAALVEQARRDFGRLVFLCYCPDELAEHCHRRLLCQVCAALGAEDLGELPIEEQKKTSRQGTKTPSEAG